MIESFWSRMQVELLDTKRWKTRIELANSIFDYSSQALLRAGNPITDWAFVNQTGVPDWEGRVNAQIRTMSWGQMDRRSMTVRVI